MNTRYAPGLVAALLVLGGAHAARSQSFASGYDSKGTYDLSSNANYNDPTNAVGQPTTLDNDGFGDPVYHASLVQPAFGQDANTGHNLLSALNSDGNGALTLTFSTPIVHSDAHYFGQDFIVYTNSFFTGTNPTTGKSYVSEGDNLSQYILNGGSFGSLPSVSVSADGVNFVTVQSQDTLTFAENPYHWDGISGGNTSGFGALQDFSKPVDPSLTAASFTNVSAADAINRLYNGSAGGVSFSIAGTGLSQVNYVRFTGKGNIDGVSLVGLAAAPEPAPWAVFALGALGLVFLRRRRAQA